MTETPQRDAGPNIEDEGIQLVSQSTDPAIIGEIRNVGGVIRICDSIGAYDPRTYVHGHGSTHNKSQPDALTAQSLSSGAAPANKTFQTDGAGGIALVDYVEAYPPNLQSGEYTTPFSTSSGAYQQFYQYTTTSLPAGIYFLAALANLDCTNAGNVTDARVQIDDAVTFARRVGPVAYVGGVSQLIGIRTTTLTAGVHNIDFDILKASGNGNVIMLSAYVTIWRVS